MHDAKGFRIEGLEDLTRQLDEVIKAASADEVEPILYSGAEIITNEVRQQAPLGPTGRLRSSPVARQLKRRGEVPAPAIAAIDRKKAPHAHLVERSRGFFRRAVDNRSNEALEHIERALDQLISRAVD